MSDVKPKTNATVLIRVRQDVAVMLDALQWSDNISTTADCVDAVAREVIETRFQKLPQAIQERALARVEPVKAA
jgi:hypothetical protein